MPTNTTGKIWTDKCTRSATTLQAVAAGKTQSRYARIYPLIFFEFYFLSSLATFIFGPVEFQISNPLTLYSYAILGQIAIAIGYWVGITKAPSKYCNLLTVSKTLKLSILAMLIMSPITIYNRDRSELSIVEAITNPGAAYAARAKRLNDRESAPLVSIVRALLGPLLGLFVPLGVIHLKGKLNAWATLWYIGLFGLLVESLLVGAAKGLFDLALVLPWFLWLRFHTGNSTGTKRSGIFQSSSSSRPSWSLAQKVSLVFLTFAVLFAGISYFGYSRQSRYEMSGGSYPLWTTCWSKDLYGITLPESVEYPVYMLSRYWTQGYLGLSECLDLPFEWSFGIGHSTFLMRYAGILSSDPDYFLNRSYPYRLESETGYSVANYWHTIYPWLASDLTFPGAIVGIAVLAYLLAQAWKDSLWGQNPFAAGFLGQILLLFYYVPANNVRLMFSEEAIAFWGLLFLWKATSRSRRFAIH